MKFELFKGKDEQYYFTLIAGNGEKIAQSEGYHNKNDAQKTIDSIKTDARDAIIVEDKPTPKTLLGK